MKNLAAALLKFSTSDDFELLKIQEQCRGLSGSIRLHQVQQLSNSHPRYPPDQLPYSFPVGFRSFDAGDRDVHVYSEKDFEAFLDCLMIDYESCRSRNPVSRVSSSVSLPRLMRRSSRSRLWIYRMLVTYGGLKLGSLVRLRDRSDALGWQH